MTPYLLKTLQQNKLMGARPDCLPETKRTWNGFGRKGFEPLSTALTHSMQNWAKSEPERPQHKPHEYARWGKPVARADRGRILALARKVNADTREPGRQGCLKATGLIVLETLLLHFLNGYTGRCDPSHASIAEAAGVGVRTAVAEAFGRLSAQVEGR